MKRFFIIGLTFAAALIVLGYLLTSYLLSPVGTSTTIQNFVINQGDSAGDIAARLQKNNLVHNRFVFLVAARYLQANNQLQAGLFKLSPSMSTPEIISKLTSGGSHDYWLKIIEGQRLAEITTQFDPALEGYIFPDSYLIPEGYSISQIQDIININFQKKLAQASLNSSTSLSSAQVVTLASLVEREARTLTSKQLVSGILHNRLKINMALQIDATVQYARDSKTHPAVYWMPISKVDIATNSLFNTYQNPGLPPSPICNPGFDSLYAAFHPTPSDYLYYITGRDNQMHYARTLTEHNDNIAKYLK